jgi:hypothetical protein
MGKYVSDVLGVALGSTAHKAIQGVSTETRKTSIGSSASEVTR